jgi:integrase
MARKAFYLIARKDVKIKGRPVFYCRFRNGQGDLLAWRSTGETSRTRAELWALARLNASKDRRENITLEAFAKDFWSPEGVFARARSDHGFTTSKNYLEFAESYTRNHLLPVWGACRLRELTPGKIDAWIVRLRRESQLAPATLNKLLSTLRTILGQALAQGYLAENPASFVKPVRTESTSRGILTPAEVMRLFAGPEIWADHRHFTLNLLAATTGMRMGEVRGLLLENVKGDHVQVRQSWEQGHGLKPPKYNSIREVPICERVAGALSRVIAEYRPTSLVFYGTALDRPLSKNCIEGNLYRTLVKVGISDLERRRRGITFHSHRHFLNTLLRSRGVPDSKVRQITGHRSPRLSDLYTHYRAEDFREVVEAQEGLLAQESKA